MGLKDNQKGLSLAAFTAFSEQEEQANADKELWEVRNPGFAVCYLPNDFLPGGKELIGKD